MAQGFSASKTAVWVLLGLLILGLAGFGATNLSGTVQNVGTVGSKPLPVETYARLLQQEIRGFEAQTGQAMPFSQAQAFGIDQAVLQRLVAMRALDHETSEMGLSIGDENLRDRIVEIPAFQGLNGEFDRDSYTFALQSSGLNESEFEAQMREEVARSILQSAIARGIEMPEIYVDTLISFIGEQRSFRWSRLDETVLETPIAPAGDAELRTYYEDNIALYTLPETKKLTYAVLSPDALLDQVEIDEEALRQAYEAREADFNRPERRLVERLVYLDEAAAAEAVGSGSAFEELVAARGLTLGDVDLGDVTQAELGTAGDDVFAAAPGSVVGPLPSDLGPALFRVNAVLAAQQTSFEEAQEILRPELAADRARRLVEAQAENLDDLLAGGATLEELAQETDMELGTIDWGLDSTQDIAAYAAFRAAASAVTLDDFPEIELLEDGGLFALRLEEILPPRPAVFEDVRENLAEDSRADQITTALRAQVEAQLADTSGQAELAAFGGAVEAEQDRLRSDFIAGVPPVLMERVFAMEIGEVAVIDDHAGLVLVRLDAVSPPDPEGDAVALAEQFRQQINQSLAQNLFNLYNTDVTLRAGPQINQQALQAVHVNFP